MGRACGAVGEERDMYRVLVGKPEGKRPMGTSRRRWEDNVGCGVVGWIRLAQNRDSWLAIVNVVMNLRVP
jgi:hypothetical protein